MRRLGLPGGRPRLPLGLLGRVFAILLLTLAIEFGVNAFLYERSSEVLLREDESRRLAEHLVVARKLLAEAPPHERPALSSQLTTDRYVVRWAAVPPPRPPVTLPLEEMRRQVLAWEPALADSQLTLRLDSPGRQATALGALRLPDGSWANFAMLEQVRALDLALGRVALALVPAVAMMLLAGLLLRRTLHPLSALADAAGHIGARAAEPVPEGGTSEVRRLVRAFNAMQTRIARLIGERTEALAAVGHDLRTPLARLALRAEAVDGETGEALRRDLAEMDAMLSSVLDYLAGDADPERPQRGDLAVLLTTLIDDAEDRGFPATYAGPDHLEIAFRQIGLKRALTNLVENALHYAGGVEVSLRPRERELRIAVEDRGPGIPAEHLAAVRQPFLRLDAARGRNTGGMGLGLAVVARVAEAEGGRLELANREGGGLSAVLILPRA